MNKFYQHCVVLVGSRNRFKLDFTMELKYTEGLMEDCLKCHISYLVEYGQKDQPKLK